MEESGSGSEEEMSGSGSDSGTHFGHRQRSFYDTPEFDHGISFDIFSRPPVEVVTRRMHGSGRRGDATLRYPLQTDASCRLEASIHLLLFLSVVTVLYCRGRQYTVVVAGTSLMSHCLHSC